MTPTQRANQILEEVAAAHSGDPNKMFYKITVADILGPSRNYEIGAARRDAAERLDKEGRNYPQIGKILKRHPSTVQNLIKPRKLRGLEQ